MKYTIDDVEQVFNECKYTFSLPSLEQIKNIKKGDIVKLIFRERVGVERMFVIVSGKKKPILNEEGEEVIKLQGTLDNSPYQLRTIKCGDRVTFDNFNIISIHGQSNEREHPDLQSLSNEDKQIIDTFAMVSNEILIDKKEITKMSRDEPAEDDDNKDSGWCFFSGQESESYMTNPDNFRSILLGRILNDDDSMLHLLNSPVGSAFKFNPNENIWEIDNEDEKDKEENGNGGENETQMDEKE